LIPISFTDQCVLDLDRRSEKPLALLPARVLETETQTITRLRSEMDALRDRIYALEEGLGAQQPFPLALALTPSEMALLGILYKRELLTNEAAFTILYGDDPNGGPSNPRATIAMLIMCLRKKLAKLPQPLFITNQHGVGFFMPRESKLILKALIEGNR
jgi:hypothetical protein